MKFLRRARMLLWTLALMAVTLLGFFDPGQPAAVAQQPTGSIPTVTGTPLGPIVTVDQSLASDPGLRGSQFI